MVETVSEASTLYRAGLRPGDVLLSWYRPANPPANPTPAAGVFGSPFEWLEFVEDQGPRGTVQLTGRRGGDPLFLSVQRGLWRARARPRLPEDLEEIYTRGRELRVAGDLESALRTWRPLLDIWRDGPLRAWLLLRMATAQEKEGAWEGAEESFRGMLRASADPLVESKAWRLLGDGYLRQSELEEAEKALTTALEIHRRFRPGSLVVSNILSHLGTVAFTRGHLDRSYRYDREALGIRQALAPGSLEAAMSFGNLGVVASSRGQLDRAEDLYLRAARLMEGLAPESLNLANILSNLGVLAQDRKDHDRAREYHRRALRIRRRLAPGSLELATSLNNLGFLAQDLGRLDEAQEFHLQALELKKRLAPGSLREATSWANLGLVAWYRGELEGAFEGFLRALRIQERVAPESLNLAISLINLGDLLSARGDLEEAEDHYARASGLLTDLAPRSRLLALALNGRGTVARKSGRVARARRFFHSALETFENQLSDLGGSYEIQAGFRAGYSFLYRDLEDVLHTLGRPAEAFHVQERFQARTFLEMLAERELDFSVDLDEDLDRERRRIAVLFDRTQNELQGLSLEEDEAEIESIQARLRKLRWQAEETEETIRRSSPRLAALRYPEPLTAEAARGSLDPGTVLVSFSVGEEKTHAYVVGREVRAHTSPLGREEMRAKVQAFRRALDRTRVPGGLGGEALRRLGRELYRDLLLPLEPWIADGERLFLVPDGPLYLLPFAALIRESAEAAGGGEEYLVEWKPLFYAASATVYDQLRKDRRPAEAPSGTAGPPLLVAFGDPDYGNGPPADGTRISDPHLRASAERNLFEWKALPFSRREVEGIARLFPDRARAFLGSEATEERVKALGPGPRFLHFATHGHYDDVMPLNSALVLTLPQGSVGGRDNGLLQAWEILEQIRLSADLVVLSACDTGKGELVEGEGLIGLSRAFQYAGARTVVASQWSADDRVTAELMVSFYRHLREGQAKDEALRSAQIEMIRAEQGDPAEPGGGSPMGAYTPYHWALFQAIGDYR